MWPVNKVIVTQVILRAPFLVPSQILRVISAPLNKAAYSSRCSQSLTLSQVGKTATIIPNHVCVGP